MSRDFISSGTYPDSGKDGTAEPPLGGRGVNNGCFSPLREGTFLIGEGGGPGLRRGGSLAIFYKLGRVTST